jgi:hypothetical protein
LGSPDGELDWFALYKLYEIVRDNVGGGSVLLAKNWAARADIDAFTTSANHPGVSGDAARHARMPGTPRRRTMALPEAQDVIRRLLSGWLDSL